MSEAFSGDAARCVLCEGPNDCAMAREGRSAGTAMVDEKESAPCWCVGKRFPEDLLARARSETRGGAARCVCERCFSLASPSRDA